VILVYAARYHIDIGPHVFPTQKYHLVHDRLLAAGIVQSSEIVEAAPANWDELALVHSAEYLEKMRTGTLSAAEIAQLELPWSTAMVEAFRLMVGGTIHAARSVCEVDSTAGVAVHIGGGFHHAFPSHGEGFCPFNDVAIAIRDLQTRGIERHAVVDLDVHHGNGTAFTFESDPRVFTFSMHQQHNYPLWKPRGSLDIGVPDGVHDATYLRELSNALPRALDHRPQCLFYVAGADPYEDDQLGGLRLTKDGLRARDRMVFDAARAAGVPTVVTLAGGYARVVEDTVAIHVATIEEARRHLSHAPGGR
jgi:acetoin utilization deacetylase AcuC-like enzyme